MGVAAPVSAAQWSSSADVRVSVLAEDNPGLAATSRGTSGSGEATVGFNVERSTERFDMHVAPRVSARRYSDDAGLDREEYRMDGGLDWRGERMRWLGDVWLSRESTLTSELGSTGLTQANLLRRERRVSLSPMFQLSERTSLQMGATVEDVDYSDRSLAALNGYVRSTASASLGRALGELLRGSLSVTGSLLQPGGGGEDSRDQSASFGLQWQGSQIALLQVSAGVSRVERAGVHRLGRTFGLGLQRQFRKASFSLDANRGLEPVGTGLITESDNVRIGAGWRVRETLQIATTLNTRQSRYLLQNAGLPSTRVRYTRAEVTMDWQLARSWSLGWQVGHAWNRQPGNVPATTGFDTRMTLSWSAILHGH
jgi:hypothetical protein